MKLDISQKTYYNGESNNTLVYINGLDIYYSYNTIVALHYKGEEIIIKNYWSTTTGKHLNYINDDKSIRLEQEEFDKRKEEIINKWFEDLIINNKEDIRRILNNMVVENLGVDKNE